MKKVGQWNPSLRRWLRITASMVVLMLSSLLAFGQLPIPGLGGLGSLFGGGGGGFLGIGGGVQKVHDPAVEAKAVATVAQIKGVIGGINRQIEHFQEAANKLRQVSKSVSTLQLLDEIKRLRDQFYNESQLCLDRLEHARKTFDQNYYSTALLAVYGTSRRLETDMEIMEIVLAGGLLSMQDADRIEALKEVKASLLAGLADVRIMRRDVENRVGYEYFKAFYNLEGNNAYNFKNR